MVAVAGGCRRAADARPAAAAAALSLPDAIAGFEAAPSVAGAGFVRRAYTRGRVRLDVTLARATLRPGGFDDWLRMSRDGFPQAALDAPPDDANGFYQCTDGPAPSCDL